MAAGCTRAKKHAPLVATRRDWPVACRVAWRGTVRSSVFAARFAGWLATLFRRLEDAARRGVPTSVSRADDSAAGAHLQPGDVPAAVVGVATFFEQFRISWNSCLARRKRSRPAELLP